MFLPKKSKIIERLVEQAAIIEEIAQVFQGIANDWGQLKNGCATLETLESKADEFVHAITDEIDKIFILPFDKEDIKELTDLLDDVADNIEQAANRLNIYKISESNQTMKDFSRIILQSVQQIQQGILMIKEHKMSSKDFVSCYQKLHDLENEGDKLHRKALENLLGEGSSGCNTPNPISILKLKEIFQTLEDALDKCEDIAIVLERLKIKYR